jgi:hypothetical protein
MQRSSETIGAIAAALAKVQAELTNPEKSLTGSIPSPLPRGEDKTFRYAPLSSGLEIIRKTLSKHEIAAVQTTAIDQQAGLVRLTTMLAHSSGEWVASEWPVCPMSETAAPHRMGAALTYARRYALFTLVGIAGEDDTDAPEVPAPPIQAASGASGPTRAVDPAAPSPDKVAVSQAGSRTRRQDNGALVRSGDLSEQQSVLCRDRLLGELEGLCSAEQLVAWAQQSLPVKNTLTTADAKTVEEAFTAKLASMQSESDDGEPFKCLVAASVQPEEVNATAASQPNQAELPLARPEPRKRRTRTKDPVDRSVLAFPEPRRIRDKEHLKFVSRQPCLVCGRKPSDPHHLRIAQPRALGRKVSDEFTVPLCRTHHRELHHFGDEARWWNKMKLDPLGAADDLWRETHPLLNVDI